MAHSDLIDSLIHTYRTLNLTVRQLPNDQVTRPGPGGRSVLEMIAALRERELAASQELKNMTIADTGIARTDIDPPPPADPNNVRVLLSEFGTAREAILALVREMSDEQWEQERETPHGPMTVRAAIERLVEEDRKFMAEIEPALAVRS